MDLETAAEPIAAEEPVAMEVAEAEGEVAEAPVKAKRGRKPGSVNAPKKDKAAANTTVTTLGSSAFPISKVAKIIKADKDIAMCQKEAVFLISVATEHFIKRITDAAYTRARMDQSKTIRYKDLSGVCAPDQGHVPGDFFFLEDVISRTTHAQFLAKPVQKDASTSETPPQKSSPKLGEDYAVKKATQFRSPSSQLNLGGATYELVTD